MGTVTTSTRRQQHTLAEAGQGYFSSRDLLTETPSTYAGTFERLPADLDGDRPLGEAGADKLAGC